MLLPDEFAISDGQDAPPSDLVDRAVWEGIVHLPGDVSIRISNHNGVRLQLMYQLWSDWIETIGDPDQPDEIFNCLLDTADCLQCTNFNFLHGFYRAALAELRTALELVTIGVYGSLNPLSQEYTDWRDGKSELGFTRCRRRLLGSLKKNQAKWMFEEEGLLAATYQTLCNYTHSRPNSSDGALWQSNGPVYNDEAIRLTFFATLNVYAVCHLLVRLARPDFTMPEGSNILFELDWMPNYVKLVQAFTELYGKPPNPPLTD
jgi:hypothetical protein